MLSMVAGHRKDDELVSRYSMNEDSLFNTLKPDRTSIPISNVISKNFFIHRGAWAMLLHGLLLVPVLDNKE